MSLLSALNKAIFTRDVRLSEEERELLLAGEFA